MEEDIKYNTGETVILQMDSLSKETGIRVLTLYGENEIAYKEILVTNNRLVIKSQEKDEVFLIKKFSHITIKRHHHWPCTSESNFFDNIEKTISSFFGREVKPDWRLGKFYNLEAIYDGEKIILAQSHDFEDKRSNEMADDPASRMVDEARSRVEKIHKAVSTAMGYN